MSGSGGVLLRANADFNRLDRAYAQVTNRVQRLEAKNSQLINKMNQFEKRGKMSAQGVGRSVANLATQYLGLRAIIQSATAAIQDNIAVARRANFKDMTLARADADLVMASMDFDPAARAQMKAWTRNRIPGWSEAEMTSAFAEGLSQTSAEKGRPESDRIKDVTEFARVVLPLYRTRKEEAGSLIGTGIAMSRSVEGTAEQILSLMTTLRSQSSLKELEALKETVPVSAAASVTSVPDATRAELLENALWGLSMQAAAMTRMAETGGTISKTGAANFLGQLREAVQEGRTHREKLEILRSDKDAMEDFISHLTGRAATKPIFEEIVRGGLTYRMLEGVLPKLRTAHKDTSAYDIAVRDAEKMSPSLIRQRGVAFSEAAGDEYLRKTQGFRGSVYEQMFGEGKGLDNIAGFRNWLVKKYAQGLFLGFSAYEGGSRQGTVRAAEVAVGEAIQAAKEFGTYTPELQTMLNDLIYKIEGQRIEEQRADREQRSYEEIRQRQDQKGQQDAERRGQTRGAAAAHARGHTE